MSDILEDLEIFGLKDSTFKHKSEDTYKQIERKRGFFGKKKSFDDKKNIERNDKFVKTENEENQESYEENEVESSIESNTENKEVLAENPEEKVLYENSGLDERILRAVKDMGYVYMSPIQKEAIPVMIKGQDIIGQAQTGTGKTAAFGIPTLSRVDADLKKLQAVILCPTRELAMQAADEIREFAKYMHGVKVLAVYGGQDISRQIRALSQGVQIVVGTPGRVMDHMRRHTMKMEYVKTLVLDEADEMLDMGFREDIEKILEGMPEDRQTALFSATMPKEILDITRKYQKEDAKYIRMTPKEITVKAIEQSYYMIPREMKFEVLTRLIDFYQPTRSLIFANTKRMVDQLAGLLKDRGYLADGLHGDLSQNQRDLVMNTFRSGRINILIATDVAARGIDVSGVDCVFNFDIPEDIEYYVHRIGRTGRAGKSGKSFTLISGREIYKLRDIEKICHTKIEERKVPSAKDITRAKAGKTFAEVVDVIENENLDVVTNFINEKIAEGQYSAEVLAAGFMKLKMGKDIEELVIPQRPRRRRDSSRTDARGRDRAGRFDKRGRAGDRKNSNFKSGSFRRDDKKRDYKSQRKLQDNGRDVRKDRNSKSKSFGLQKPSRNMDRYYGRVAIKTRGVDGKYHSDKD